MGRISRVWVVFAVVLAVGLAAQPATAALVAHYEFEDDVTDSTTSFDGTAFGGPMTYGAGVNGQAIDLSGSGQYVNLAAA
ncbi:hypothetical protein ACFL09_04475, partial [Planctomycetota bacterium]